MRVVVALGGNALLPRGTRPDEAPQVEQVGRVAPALARLAAAHEVVLVHGNGPQVGLLALESAADGDLSAPYPLDDLVAETQGLIGYWLQRELAAHLPGAVVTLVSQVVVDPSDPAFAHPTKFVGSSYEKEQALLLARRYRWDVHQDGTSWRRVVPSPRPVRVVETDLVRTLLEQGATVVTAGGGGVPVVERGSGLRGVEAVVDKDLTACELAVALAADLLLVLTDVGHVMTGFGTPAARPVRATTPEELDAGDWPAGSMGPKVEAAASFVRRTGRRAAIGALDDALAVVDGTTGTQVAPAR